MEPGDGLADVAEYLDEFLFCVASALHFFVHLIDQGAWERNRLVQVAEIDLWREKKRRN